jgi:hypothetical protein
MIKNNSFNDWLLQKHIGWDVANDCYITLCSKYKYEDKIREDELIGLMTQWLRENDLLLLASALSETEKPIYDCLVEAIN